MLDIFFGSDYVISIKQNSPTIPICFVYCSCFLIITGHACRHIGFNVASSAYKGAFLKMTPPMHFCGYRIWGWIPCRCLDSKHVFFSEICMFFPPKNYIELPSSDFFWKMNHFWHAKWWYVYHSERGNSITSSFQHRMKRCRTNFGGWINFRDMMGGICPFQYPPVN